MGFRFAETAGAGVDSDKAGAEKSAAGGVDSGFAGEASISSSVAAEFVIVANDVVGVGAGVGAVRAAAAAFAAEVAENPAAGFAKSFHFDASAAAARTGSSVEAALEFVSLGLTEFALAAPLLVSRTVSRTGGSLAGCAQALSLV